MEALERKTTDEFKAAEKRPIILILDDVLTYMVLQSSRRDGREAGRLAFYFGIQPSGQRDTSNSSIVTAAVTHSRPSLNISSRNP